MNRPHATRHLTKVGNSENRALLTLFMIAVLSSLSVIILHLRQAELNMAQTFKKSKILLNHLLSKSPQPDFGQPFSMTENTPNTFSGMESGGTILRENLGSVLQNSGSRIGVELGAKSGLFSHQILHHWRNCTRFYLVDTWKSQPKSMDEISSQDSQPMREMFEARSRLAQYSNQTKIFFLPMFTSDALEFIHDGVDFVYLDTLYDYCTVKENMKTWWPKIREGGYLGGNNFLNNSEMQWKRPSQDWSACADGSIHAGATKQAVLEFVEREGLKLIVTADEWPTWLVRKGHTKRMLQYSIEATGMNADSSVNSHKTISGGNALSVRTRDTDVLIADSNADTWNKFKVITCLPAEVPAARLAASLNRRFCASVGCEYLVHPQPPPSLPAPAYYRDAASLGSLPAATARHPQRLAAELIHQALSAEPRARMLVWADWQVGMLRPAEHPAELLQGFDCAVGLREDGSADASLLLLRNSAWTRRLVSAWHSSHQCAATSRAGTAQRAEPCCAAADCLGPAIRAASKDSESGAVRYLPPGALLCSDGGGNRSLTGPPNRSAACLSWAVRVVDPAASGDAAALAVLAERYGSRGAGETGRGIKIVSFSDRPAADVIVAAAFRILQARRSGALCGAAQGPYAGLLRGAARVYRLRCALRCVGSGRRPSAPLPLRRRVRRLRRARVVAQHAARASQRRGETASRSPKARAPRRGGPVAVLREAGAGA